MPTLPPTSIGMSFVSSPAHLPVVRASVEKLCQLVGFDAKTSAEVVVSVDEALANIIKHAYGDRGDGPIEMTLTALCDEARPTGIEVVLRDQGNIVEPESIRGRDLEDVRPGGLGTHIMGAYMDSVAYAHREAGGTRLTMVKYLSGCRPPGPPSTTEATGGQ